MTKTKRLNHSKWACKYQGRVGRSSEESDPGSVPGIRRGAARVGPAGRKKKLTWRKPSICSAPMHRRWCRIPPGVLALIGYGQDCAS